MPQPPLPKPVFVKRKPSSKRRRRTEIPSPPHSPERPPTKPTDVKSGPTIARPDPPRRSCGHLMRAKDVTAQASLPAPFTAAWNPSPRPDELAVEDEPDLSFLPTQGNSSDDGWEAVQLARGGGKVEEQDLSHVIRHAEETPQTDGNITRLRAALKQAKEELDGRALIASERTERARLAVAKAGVLREEAEKEVLEREGTLQVYEEVLIVFREVCEVLRREKEGILGYRKAVLERLEKAAEEVRVGLLGGVDEFGRNVPGRLSEIDDSADEGERMQDVGEGNVELNPPKRIEDVVRAVEKWKNADAEGFRNGFGAQGGGNVVGRLGLALPNTEWVWKCLDGDTRIAALKSGMVGRLVAAEIRAFWEPRRKSSFRRWGKLLRLFKTNGERGECGFEEVEKALQERFKWEVDACLVNADEREVRRCLTSGMEALDVLDEHGGDVRRGIARLKTSLMEMGVMDLVDGGGGEDI